MANLSSGLLAKSELDIDPVKGLLHEFSLQKKDHLLIAH